MSQIYFDVDKRNLELIMTLMEIVGVADCEELPNKVNELKRAAPFKTARMAGDVRAIYSGRGFRRNDAGKLELLDQKEIGK